MLRLGSKVRLAKNSFSLRPAQVAFRFTSSSVAGAADIKPRIKDSPFKDFGYDDFPGYGLPNPACNVFDHYKWRSSLQPFPVYKYMPVMSRAMYDEREKAPVARANAYDLVHGVEMAFQKVRDHLIFRTSQPVLSFEGLIQIGTVAANGDRHIGELVAKAIDKVGPDGAFIISDKMKSNNELVFDKGMSLDFGLISPLFITNKEQESCVLRNPFILIHENEISSGEIYSAAGDLGIQFNNRPLLVITGDIEKDEMASLFGEWDLAGSKVYIAKPLKYSEDTKGIMQDLAILTGGHVNMVGTKQIFGCCREVRATRCTMVVLGGSGSNADIAERCGQLKTAIELSTSDNEVELLEERLDKLYRGAAVFKVHGKNKAEVREKNKKIRCALEAAKTAKNVGILPGGGVALLHASKELDKLHFPGSDEQLGVQMFQHALKMPVYSIASTAGLEGTTIVKKLMEQENPNIGYDSTTDSWSLACNIEEESLFWVQIAFVNACPCKNLLTTTSLVESGLVGAAVNMDNKILHAMSMKRPLAKCASSSALTLPKRTYVTQTSSPPLALPPILHVRKSVNEKSMEKSLEDRTPSIDHALSPLVLGSSF